MEGDGVVEGEFWKVEWLLDWISIYVSFDLSLPSDLSLWLFEDDVWRFWFFICGLKVDNFDTSSEFKLNKVQEQEGKLTEGDFDLRYEAVV